MSVTIKLLTLVVISLMVSASYSAEKKQVNLKAQRVAKSQTHVAPKKAENSTDMVDLTVEDATANQDTMDTMEFHSQLPSDLETETK